MNEEYIKGTNSQIDGWIYSLSARNCRSRRAKSISLVQNIIEEGKGLIRLINESRICVGKKCKRIATRDNLDLGNERGKLLERFNNDEIQSNLLNKGRRLKFEDRFRGFPRGAILTRLASHSAQSCLIASFVD